MILPASPAPQGSALESRSGQPVARAHCKPAASRAARTARRPVRHAWRRGAAPDVRCRGGPAPAAAAARAARGAAEPAGHRRVDARRRPRHGGLRVLRGRRVHRPPPQPRPALRVAARARRRGRQADGDGAVALRDGLLAEVVGDLAPGACAGALLESLAAASKLAERRALEAANAKTNAEIALEVSQGHETKELRLEEELKRALHELREERRAAAGLREAADDAAAARDAAVAAAEEGRAAGHRAPREAATGRQGPDLGAAKKDGLAERGGGRPP